MIVGVTNIYSAFFIHNDFSFTLINTLKMIAYIRRYLKDEGAVTLSFKAKNDIIGMLRL